MSTTIKMPPPAWREAVKIHSMVLRNPEAGFEAVEGAMKTIEFAGGVVDLMNKFYKELPPGMRMKLLHLKREFPGVTG